MGEAPPLRLVVVTAVGVEVDEGVDKVSVESVDGAFTMLPRHIDIAAPLAVGLVTFVVGGVEHLVAVDGGLVVKAGSTVSVATPQAVRGDSSQELERLIEERFRDIDEGERRARTALARLEQDVLSHMVESGELR